ncbi:hypothetical protein DFJ58DRAFT_910303 [Suillus subalutaceus]|uniref:uncharacterized protein n=1 Tax=Suillus subalutaceus TaxID=48586 RepID=UPI001B86E94C|nr:uncharacterized protein DFJ58DRAFT_910303 [Suillus subalutaceus]KAG1874777.1 hypothetical protein DFJ58DRAFT_910303 [Suillus subalutaceus]
MSLLPLIVTLVSTWLNIPVPKESKYNFSDFSLDADWTAEIGEAADRGPEPEAVVDVLETWIKKYPGDILLEKWVYDTLEAARGLILAAGNTLPVLDVEVDSTKHKPVNVNNHQPEKRKKRHQKRLLRDQQPEKPTVVPLPARPPMKRDIAMNDSDDETSEGRGLMMVMTFPFSDQPVQLEPTAPVSHGPPFELTAGAVTSSTTPMDDEREIWESAE